MQCLTGKIYSNPQIARAITRLSLSSLFYFACTLSLLAFCLPANAQTMNSVGSGELLFDSENSQAQAALHLKTDISMEIDGMINRVIVQQSFRNDTQQWQEGVYVFPLPEDSAVNKVRLILNDREIVGEIHERVEAQQIYQQARSEGRKAALVEQQRPNMFTQKVANIAPGETITVELQYIQAIRYDSGSFSLRFPMTITPRYVPGILISEMEESQTFQNVGGGWAMPTNLVPDADRISPPYLSANLSPDLQNLASLHITLNTGLKLSSLNSPSHELDIVEGDGAQNQTQLSFKDGTVRMDRDFELQWTPISESAPLAATFADQVGDSIYMQLMLIPPQIKQSATGLSREFIIVLDTSGSMGGNSIIQARQSVELALSRLSVNDVFNVIEFNSSFRPVFTSSQPANSSNIQQALRFVRGLDAGGGTNMESALEYALANEQEDGSSLLKQVVFITDGSVGNEEQLFRLISAHLGNTRLFTVGIGSAPNSYFMRKSAELGRGSYTFISDLNQIAPKMNILFRKLENAVMAGVQISWPEGTTVEYYPEEIPDLYLGEPLFVTAKVEVEGDMAAEQLITISGEIEGQSWQRKINLVTGDEIEELVLTDSGLATYWARQKIESLLDNLRMGAAEDDIKKQVLAVSLPFQLLSPYSSFVAVEKTISRPVTNGLFSSPVANDAPAGQDLAARMAGQNSQMQQIVYPRTATAAAQHFIYGLLALTLLLILCFLSRERRVLI